MVMRWVFLLVLTGAAWAGQPTNPILFVAQVPVPADFTTITSVFGNHKADLDSVARGGDLMIRYPDGTVKNLTQLAGFGSAGQQQDDKSIAVREPSVHWSGTKAIFSMVIGAPKQQYDYSYTGYWQLYEITGLGQNETPVITKVPNQPANFNNISPTYGVDERIIFTTDRPRDGAQHLYPQRDEYERAPTVSGIWSLNPTSGDLFLMTHDPSGSFTPIVDSFGRVIFTRWDHLQRDQEADADALITDGSQGYGSFNYSDETAAAKKLPRMEEFFPEPRGERTDLLKGTNLQGHSFNQFFPWMINQDGTAEETINHIGRHELFNYFDKSLNDDPNVVEFFGPGNRANQNRIENMLQIKEDPLNPGLYYGIDAPEFATHAAGQIITLSGPPTLNPDQMLVKYITARATSSFNEDNAPADPTNSGHYRNPVPLSDGGLIAAHTAETRADKIGGTTAAPTSRYDFRLKTVVGGVAGTPLTQGIPKTVSYWTPDVLVTFIGNLWEIDPVEVRARPKPVKPADPLADQEKAVLDEEQVDIAALKAYMTKNNLALIVSRNLTTRDQADKQQPTNLRIAGTQTQSVPNAGKIYDMSFMQLFQGDALRGSGYNNTPQSGRRLLATPMHDAGSANPQLPPSVPAGSVQLGADGSMAAFVPARRAMTWQTLAPDGTPVVRERYWLSFQPGEIRTCTSCHGINTKDQMNNPVPQNKPEALRSLMKYWKAGPQDPTLKPPTFNSPPTATPNPAKTGHPVTLSAAATGNEPLTYTWDFGDTTAPQTGASQMHVYAAAGTFNATVTVADVNNLTVSGTVQVVVTPSTPFTPGKGQIQFDFKKSNHDSFSLSGTAPLPAGFDPKGKMGKVTLGAFNGTATLNGKKSATTIQLRSKKGAMTFSVSLKSVALFNAVSSFGFTNTNATQTQVMLPVTIELDGTVMDADVPFLYTAKMGKLGKGTKK